MKNFDDVFKNHEVTNLLLEMETADEALRAAAKEKLLALIYPVLQDLSRGILRPNDRAARMFNPSDLVNEAVLRLLNVPGGKLKAPTRTPDPNVQNANEEKAIDNRNKLFAFVAKVMRNVVMDKVRKELGRGKEQRVIVTLGSLQLNADSFNVDLIDLDNAIEKLRALDPMGADILECRLWIDLTIEETARALNTSEATVKRKFRFARAFLEKQLDPK